MFLHRRLLGCRLLTACVCVCVCLADNGGTRAKTASGATLQPWLVALSAVVGFLFLVFVLLLVKRLFFTEDRTMEEDTEDPREEDSREEPETEKQTNL
ncbi:small integral membrane protein 24 [Arapaima gigas]